MASQIGQTQTGIAAVGTATTSPHPNTTGATLLVMTCGAGVDPTTGTASDSFGNTWHAVAPGALNSPNPGSAIFFAFDKAGAPLVGGLGHTGTIAGLSVQAITFSAFAGTPPGKNPLIGFSNGTALVSPIQTPNALAINGDALVVSSFAAGDTGVLYTPSGLTPGATILSVSSVHWGNAMAWTETGSPVNPSWSYIGAPGSLTALQNAAFASTPGSLINARILRLSHTEDGVKKVSIIAEIVFNFSNTQSIFLDWEAQRQLRGLSVRSVYIDLSKSDSPLTITDNYSGIPIMLVGRSQGWIPLLFQEPLQITVQFLGGQQAPNITLRFSSSLVPPFVWRTS